MFTLVDIDNETLALNPQGGMDDVTGQSAIALVWASRATSGTA